MKPLHQILPDIEDAVARRIEDPTVTGLGEGDLRTLVYQIVEAYQRRLCNPDEIFEAMVDSASSTMDRFRGEKSNGVLTRAQMLDRILPIAARAMPALSTPIRELIKRSGGSQHFVNHTLLRGIELAHNRKTPVGDNGAKTICGRSWWAIALAGEPVGADARWAVLEHAGTIESDGSGIETVTITFVDAIDLAEQITDRIMVQILTNFAARLRDISGGELPRMIEHDEASRLRIEAALEAMNVEASP